MQRLMTIHAVAAFAIGGAFSHSPACGIFNRMTTREALIAAIADKPGDDLPRLVAADWFEENGEAERAEFIRLQLEYATRPEDHRYRWDCPRLDERVRGHALQWFAPFIHSLDPATSLDEGYRSSNSTPTHTIVNLSGFPSDRDAFVLLVVVKRGFAERLWLNLNRIPDGCQIETAMRFEPIRTLVADLPPDEHVWSRFTHPSLNRLHELALQEGTDGQPPTSIIRVLHDPNLSGVRRLALQPERRSYPPHPPLGRAVAEEFARSDLSGRVDELAIRTTDEGLDCLVSCHGLRLSALELTGPITQAALARIGDATFAPLLSRLKLSTELDDEGLAAVARCHTFPKLVDLELCVHSDTTNVGVAALAMANFVPRLERLSLVTDSQQDWELLRPLLEVLQPQTLRELHLPLWREREMPDVVRQRFGSVIRRG